MEHRGTNLPSLLFDFATQILNTGNFGGLQAETP